MPQIHEFMYSLLPVYLVAYTYSWHKTACSVVSACVNMMQFIVWMRSSTVIITPLNEMISCCLVALLYPMSLVRGLAANIYSCHCSVFQPAPWWVLIYFGWFCFRLGSVLSKKVRLIRNDQKVLFYSFPHCGVWLMWLLQLWWAVNSAPVRGGGEEICWS